MSAIRPARTYALVAQQTYQKLGMDVSIDSQEFNKWYDRTGKSDYDMFVAYWITPADPNALDQRLFRRQLR